MIASSTTSTSVSHVLITPDDDTPWYALRLHGKCLHDVRSLFESHHFDYFIPMRYVERTDVDGKCHRVLAPVVSNLIFLKKTITAQDLRLLITERALAAHLITRSREDSRAYEIPARQMREFIYICDPDKVLYRIVTSEEAAMTPGTLVEVTRGPLKGCRGRLVRKQHLHYLLHIYTGFAVLAKVTKWCCKPIAEN